MVWRDYLLIQIKQLLPAFVDEPIQRIHLFAIHNRYSQRVHQRRDIRYFLYRRPFLLHLP